MDPERQRIQDDLRGLVAGDVRCDDLFLQLYASDASIFEIKPLGVVRPRSTDDVVACVRYAGENQIPVHARGAGTGLAGESIGPGLVLDFSCYMRRILSTEDDTVRVQPGVVHAHLNEHLSEQGRVFGPDPATSYVTTMGSVVALDGGGSHWPRYGSARRHVRSAQVVLANGDVLHVNGQASSETTSAATHVRHEELRSSVSQLVTKNSELIAQCRPRSPVNRSGYRLDDVLEDGRLNLARLLTGSEGTLALFTELTVATQPAVKHRGVVLLWFATLDQASRAVLEILPTGPSACDLMDRRHLSLARESDVRYELMIPRGAEAVLLVEYDGETMAEVRERLAEVVDRVQRKKRLSAGSHPTMDPEEVDLCWQLARKFVPTLYGMKGATRPLPFVEDIAVPPDVLPDFLVRLQNVLKRHHTIASVFGHACQGQLHVRPLLDLSNPEHVGRMQQLADDLYTEVFDVGGTISGEHGDGLSRTPFLARQYGPLCEVFRDLKQLFDPASTLNPGKIVSTEPARLARHLRMVSYPDGDASVAGGEPSEPLTTPPTVPLQLSWSQSEFADAARQCNGCGVCRTQAPDARMCPIFRLSPIEEASPRAKANLIRGMMTGQLDPDWLTTDELKSVADLCVHCHQCRFECPAKVDIPKLMAEAKGAYVQTNGLRPTDWFMTRVDTISGWASRFHRLANWALTNRQARWILEKTLGLAQGRRLPQLARRTFMNRAARGRLTRPTRRSGAKVLYFVDTYANYYDPELAEALVAVFEHNGVAVYVPPNQKHSGMPLIAAGALEKAKQIATHNVALLAEGVRQGYTIVATEPSAVLSLTREYVNLLDDDDARTVAANTQEACHFLWRLHQQGELELDFKPQSITVGYHAPCHLKALEIGLPGENLLRLIPGLTVRHKERGCSGMAGTYGLKRENFRNSLRAGWGVISALRDTTLQAGTTECSTCKMQIEQGTGKPTVHPLKLLALAYGVKPELASRLTRPAPDLVVT